MTARERFSNPWPTQPPRGHGSFVRWALAHHFRRPRDPERPVVDVTTSSFARPRADRTDVSITWIGHSTTLVQIGGLNVLTDPVWANRASPVRFAGPRRRLPPAVELAALPPIDVVLISHDHYDHLDVRTVRHLVAMRSETTWLVPVGLGALVRNCGARTVHERRWWEQRSVDTLEFACVPAQHSSGRGISDRNRSLWCGWTIATRDTPRRAIYFAGDTAYFPGFAEIGTRLGPFDACLLPIGAYEPRQYMRYVHMAPEDAVRAYHELCSGGVTASKFVPVHWGTFRIADDPLDEPPRRLVAEWNVVGFPKTALALLCHGETLHLSGRSPNDAAWPDGQAW